MKYYTFQYIISYFCTKFKSFSDKITKANKIKLDRISFTMPIALSSYNRPPPANPAVRLVLHEQALRHMVQPLPAEHGAAEVCVEIGHGDHRPIAVLGLVGNAVGKRLLFSYSKK